MTTCILNIGTRCTDGAELSQTALYKALRAFGIPWDRVDFIPSTGEDTFVVLCEVEHDVSVDILANALDQECIALWDCHHREGRMIGPQKAKWGEFDPALFILPSGCTLASARSVA